MPMARARVARPGEGAAEAGGWRSGGTIWEEFTAKGRKSLLQGGVFKPIERTTGYEDKINVGREGGLVSAETLAEAAFGAGAGDGVADGRAGGDEAGAGRRGCGWRGGIRRIHCSQRRTARGVKNRKRAAIEAPADVSDMVEIPLAAEVLLGTEAHDGRLVKHETPSVGPGFR